MFISLSMLMFFIALLAIVPGSRDSCHLLDKARFVEQNWGCFKA
jgi:hypothetical protein